MSYVTVQAPWRHPSHPTVLIPSPLPRPPRPWPSCSRHEGLGGVWARVPGEPGNIRTTDFICREGVGVGASFTRPRKVCFHCGQKRASWWTRRPPGSWPEWASYSPRPGQPAGTADWSQRVGYAYRSCPCANLSPFGKHLQHVSEKQKVREHVMGTSGSAGDKESMARTCDQAVEMARWRTKETVNMNRYIISKA